VVNRSGYDSADLERFFDRALRALGCRESVTVVVTSSPVRSRGCADIRQIVCSDAVCRAVGKARMSIAIARPSYSSPAEFVRRLARLTRHEYLHLIGYRHEDMRESDLYSEGPTPSWARGAVIRYRGRAPNQLPLLRRGLTRT
jgi:hypothetical protein